MDIETQGERERERERKREREKIGKEKDSEKERASSAPFLTPAWMALLTEIKSKHYSTSRHFLIEY